MFSVCQVKIKTENIRVFLQQKKKKKKKKKKKSWEIWLGLWAVTVMNLGHKWVSCDL